MDVFALLVDAVVVVDIQLWCQGVPVVQCTEGVDGQSVELNAGGRQFQRVGRRCHHVVDREVARGCRATQLQRERLDVFVAVAVAEDQTRGGQVGEGHQFHHAVNTGGGQCEVDFVKAGEFHTNDGGRQCGEELLNVVVSTGQSLVDPQTTQVG